MIIFIIVPIWNNFFSIIVSIRNDDFLSLFWNNDFLLFWNNDFFIIVLLGTIASSGMIDFSFPMDIFFIIVPDGSMIFFYNHCSGTMIFYYSGTMIFLSLFLWNNFFFGNDGFFVPDETIILV